MENYFIYTLEFGITHHLMYQWYSKLSSQVVFNWIVNKG